MKGIVALLTAGCYAAVQIQEVSLKHAHYEILNERESVLKKWRITLIPCLNSFTFALLLLT